MSKLPSLTAKQIINVLLKAGFIKDRQKGSHLILVNHQINARTVIPVHGGKTIKKSLMHGIINDAKLSVDEFIELL